VIDLNKLSKNARSAAMRGGTSGWGQYGSDTQIRYMEEIKTRKRCRCGCGGRKTHVGMANGVGLMSGCEFSVRRWVKEGE